MSGAHHLIPWGTSLAGTLGCLGVETPKAWGKEVQETGLRIEGTTAATTPDQYI